MKPLKFAIAALARPPGRLLGGGGGAYRSGYTPSGLVHMPLGYEEQRALWRYYPRRGSDPTQRHSKDDLANAEDEA